MAINPTNINVGNLNPNTGLGVSLNFQNPGIFNTTYSTQESIKANLINYMLTNPGEIPGNPIFGGGLRNFLFSQVNENTMGDIKSNVQSKISEIFPMVVVDELNVYESNPNSIYIDIFYSMPSISPTATGSLQLSTTNNNV